MMKLSCVLVLLLLPSLGYGWALKATQLIQDSEGFRAKVYRCQAGKKTIGYGFTDKNLIAKGSMTKDEANNILNVKVLEAGRRIRRLVGKDVELTDGQLAALISLYFNIGEGNFKESTLLKVVRTGQLADAPSAIRMWVKYTDKESGSKLTSKGLVIRRAREIKLWLTA